MMFTETSFRSAKAFARYALAENKLMLRPFLDEICVFDNRAVEVILFREACWQITLIATFPNVEIERHRHLRCDSADVGLAGVGKIRIGDRERVIKASLMRGNLGAQLLMVPKRVWHSGIASEKGNSYLSFQKWDGKPGFVSEDWEAWSPEKT